MSTSTMSLRSFRQLSSRKAAVTPQLDWEGSCDFSHDGTRWVAEDKSGFAQGIYSRPFVDGREMRYWGKSLRFSDFTQRELRLWIEDATTWFVKDDGVTVVKVDGDLGIEVEPTVGKTDKRLSRLFNQQPLWGWFECASVEVREIALGPAGTLAMDGCDVTLSWKFAKRVLRNSLAPFEEALRQAADADEAAEIQGHIRSLKRMLKGKQPRVYLTAMTTDGQLKGHALVRSQKADVEVVKGAWKQEVRLTDPDQLFVMFGVAHKAELRIDVQNLTMHGTHGLWDGWLMDKVREHLTRGLDALEDGTWLEQQVSRLEQVEDEITLDKMRRWWLMEFVASGGDPRWFANTIGMAAKGTLDGIVSSYGRMAFPVPGHFRHYIATDYRFGMTVPRGEYRLIGCNLIVNAVDYLTADPSFENIHALNAWMEDGGRIEDLAPGIAETLGGCDQDDLIVVLDQFISRSPTMVGEYWWFDKMAGDLGLNKDKLPPAPTTEYGELAGNKLTGRELDSALCACAMLRKGAGAVGVAAKSLRYYVGAMGELPPELPANMESIVDTAVQQFGDCSAAVRFFRQLTKDLARSGVPIPAEFVTEFSVSTGLVAGEDYPVAEHHWIDDLMAEYRDAVREFLAGVEKLKARAMPPQAFLDYFVPAEAGAKKYRQFYGGLWREFEMYNRELHHHTDVDEALAEAEAEAEMADWFDGVREQSEGFLSVWADEDRIDVVGATLALVYKGSDGAEAPRDFIVFQRGDIRDLALQAMRKAGILGEPVIVDGELMLAVEEDPTPPRWHFPVYGAWAYTAGLPPSKVRGAERERLQARDYAEPAIGRVYEVVETQVMVRGKVESRVALLDVEQEQLLGTLPRGFLGIDLPEMLRVVGAFIFDNNLVLTGEAHQD